MNQKVNATIIGLGNVGFLFDEDINRVKKGEIGWTHYYAYNNLSKYYKIKSVVDSDPKKLLLIKNRNLNIECFQNVEDLLNQNRSLGIVSICTPNKTHIDLVNRIQGKAKAIFLEKPVSSYKLNSDLINFKDKITKSGISIRVNYYKVNEPAYVRLKKEINQSHIKYCCLKYSGPIEAVGSHGLSILHDIMGPIKLLKKFNYPSDEDFGSSAIFYSRDNNFFGDLIFCNNRKNLIFEFEVIDNSKKIILDNNFSRIRIYKYKKSSRYSMGYRELKKVEEAVYPVNKERFFLPLKQIYTELNDNKRDYDNLDLAISVQTHINQIMGAQ